MVSATASRLLTADSLCEAGVGPVHVEEDGSTAGVVADAVQRPRRGSEERTGPGPHDVVAQDELGLAVQHEEAVHLVRVLVRPDARPVGLDFESEHGDLGEVAEDRVHPVLALEALAAAGWNDQRVGGRSAAVGRRRVLVEVAAPTEVVGEATARRMEVQESQLSGTVVVEAVDDSRGHHGERAGGSSDADELGPELESHVAREHVKGVDVVEVDMRLGAALPDGVARPGDVQPVVVAEDAQLAVRFVADRLALALAGN